MKRLLSVLLALSLLFCYLPLAVSADVTGACGDSATWSFNSSTGVLTISGTGDMYLGQYTSAEEWPWAEHAEAITKVSVSSGITSIGPYAFSYLPALTSVSLPSSLDYIFEGAFEGCENLKSLTLPEGLLALDSFVFYGCTALENITLPKSLEIVGYGTFAYCSSLTKFAVHSSNKNYSSDSSGALFNKNKTILLAVPGGHSGGYSIPGGVITVYPYAMSGCTGITGVYLPSSVSQLSSMAFDGCEKLENIWVSADSATYSHDSQGLLYNKDKTTLLMVPTGKTGTVTVPQTVETIGEGAAFCCYLLEGITVPESVLYISDYAFYGCLGLKEISLPGVKYIGEEAFSSCLALEKVTLSEKTETIGNSAFYQCLSLTEVNNTKNVSKIGDYAFSRCMMLESFTFPQVNHSLGDYAFAECVSLKEITLSPKSGSMGEYIFTNCYSLEKADLSALHYNVAIGTFMNCYSLREVVFPSNKSVHLNILDYAFANCISLESINVQLYCNFGPYSFYGCSSLTEFISTTSSSIHIYERAFAECGDALTLYIPGYYEAIAENAFENTTATFYYRSNDFWNFEWHENNQLDYMGQITWLPYDPDCVEHAYRVEYYVDKLTCHTCRCCGYTEMWIDEGLTYVKIGRDRFNNMRHAHVSSGAAFYSETSLFRTFPLVSDPAEAPKINIAPRVDFGKGYPLAVNIPLDKPSYGAVCCKVEEDGSYTVLPQTVVTDNGVQITSDKRIEVVVVDKSIKTFTDTSDYWKTDEFENALAYLTARGIIAGKTSTTFVPRENIQRRTVALVLWRIAGSPTVPLDTKLTDTENLGKTYLMAVCWAEDAGIITGYSDNTFRGEQELERRHFALMLYRFTKYMNIKLDGTTTKKLSEFQDYGKIGSSSWSACQWAVDNGIINGRSEDTLDPTGLTARGQMAVILYRYLQKYYAAQ